MVFGVKFKTTVVISLIMIISLGSISVSGYLFSKEHLTHANNSLIEKIAEDKANEVQNFINDAIIKVEGIAMLEGLKNTVPEEGVKTLATIYPRYETTFDNISFANSEGTRWNYKGEKDSISDRKYFAQAMSTKKPAVSDVLISNTTGKLSVVVAAPIIDNEGNAKGIAYATLNLAKLQEITEKLHYGDSGFGYIFDEKGTILSHEKDPKLVGKIELSKADDTEPLKFVWDNRKQSSENKQLKSKSSGEKIINILTPISISGVDNWYFGLSINEKEVLKTVNILGETFLIISSISMVIAIVVIVIYSNTIVSPIVKLNKIAQGISQGDLTKTDNTIKGKDELGQLSNSINVMTHSLRNMVKVIIEKAELLAASSQELNASTEEFYASAQCVSATVENVQKDSLKQQDAVTQSSYEVEQGLGLIQDLSNNTKNIVYKVGDTAEVAEKGQLAVHDAVNQMEEILEESKHIEKYISELNNKSIKIGTITGSITEIATQTNLLALNAAIEAARAGESGRGFAVVADEVRKLAEQAQASAVLISDLVNETQKDTATVVDEMKGFLVKIHEGAQVIENAGEIFKIISRDTKEAAEGISSMSMLLENVAQSSKNIDAAISNIKEVTNTATTAIASISDEVKQQTDSTEGIATSAESLSRLAEEFSIMVSEFKV